MRKKKSKPKAAPTAPKEPRSYSFTAKVIDPESGRPYEYTGKEIEFINAYMSDPRHHATNAAIAAGYTSKTSGGMRAAAAQVMARPRVRSAINQAFEALAMPKMEILFRLARIAGGSVADVLNDDNELDLDVAKERGTDLLIRKIERRRDVVEVKSTETLNAGSLDQESTTELIERSIIKETVKFEIHDPLRALELLGKNSRLFSDRIEHSGPGGGPIKTDGPAPQVVLYLPDNGRQALTTEKPAERTARTVKTTPGTGKRSQSANKSTDPPAITPNPASKAPDVQDPPARRAPKRRTM